MSQTSKYRLGPVRAEPRFSLLRISAAQRAGGAAVLVALLWAAVFWALHE